MKTRVWVTLQKEALHCWPECPFEDVAFLRKSHRHLFHIRCEKEVRHDDRDVEFIRWKREVSLALDRLGYDLGRMSCEELAKWLLQTFDCHSVEVSEDGENGAIVEA
jgi:hypothetical protein